MTIFKQDAAVSIQLLTQETVSFWHRRTSRARSRLKKVASSLSNAALTHHLFSAIQPKHLDAFAASMASKTSTFTRGPLRLLLAVDLAAQWVSSLIVLGLVTYFIHAFGRETHDTYEVIIVSGKSILVKRMNAN